MKNQSNLNHNMEPAFMRELYFASTQVPDYLLANYSEIGLTDRELIDLLRILAAQDKRQPYIQQDKIQAQWPGQRAEMTAALAALTAKGVLQPVEEAAAPGGAYSLAGLYAKLLELWVFQHSVPPEPAQPVAGAAPPPVDEREIIKAAYQLFEGEFARPLSPLEMEKLNLWLIADRWDFAMLREAMRRAVLHNALNLAYIDKILLRWKREGIASLEQLAAAEARSSRADADRPAEKTPRREAGRSKRSRGKAAEPSFASGEDYRQYF